MKTKAISRSDAIAIYNDNYNWGGSQTERVKRLMQVFELKDKKAATTIYSTERVFHLDNFLDPLDEIGEEGFAKFLLFCKVVREYIHRFLIPNLEHANCDDIIWGFVDEVPGFPQDWRFWSLYEIGDLKKRAKEMGVK